MDYSTSTEPESVLDNKVGPADDGVPTLITKRVATDSSASLPLKKGKFYNTLGDEDEEDYAGGSVEKEEEDEDEEDEEESEEEEEPLDIKFFLCKPKAKLPTQAYTNAACIDLYPASNGVIPGISEETGNIPVLNVIETGLEMEIPKGWAGKIFERSGASMKQVTVTAGVIDSDYRGEVKILMTNNTRTAWHYTTEKPIAQMWILPVPKVTITKITHREEFTSTERADKGFGSSSG